MFENNVFGSVGKTCKELATKIFNFIFLTNMSVAVLVLVGGLIVASEWEEPLVGWVAVLVAFVIGFTGFYKALLQTIVLYAKGELVEKVTEIDNKLDEFKKSDTNKVIEEVVAEEKTESKQPIVAVTDMPRIVDTSISETDKAKINSFLSAVENCSRVKELLEKWNELDLEDHPKTAWIKAEIEKTNQLERMYGRNPNSFKKLVDKIISCLSDSN